MLRQRVSTRAADLLRPGTGRRSTAWYTRSKFPSPRGFVDGSEPRLYCGRERRPLSSCIQPAGSLSSIPPSGTKWEGVRTELERACTSTAVKKGGDVRNTHSSASVPPRTRRSIYRPMPAGRGNLHCPQSRSSSPRNEQIASSQPHIRTEAGRRSRNPSLLSGYPRRKRESRLAAHSPLGMRLEHCSTHRREEDDVQQHTRRHTGRCPTGNRVHTRRGNFR
jgi:hypothetical protein